MYKETQSNLESIAASCLLLVQRIKYLEELAKCYDKRIEHLETQVLTLHQRSHTHAPMYGNFTGNAPIDCTKAGVT